MNCDDKMNKNIDIKQGLDIEINHGAEILFSSNKKIIWINVDGICRLRLTNKELKLVYIEISNDRRKI